MVCGWVTGGVAIYSEVELSAACTCVMHAVMHAHMPGTEPIQTSTNTQWRDAPHAQTCNKPHESVPLPSDVHLSVCMQALPPSPSLPPLSLSFAGQSTRRSYALNTRQTPRVCAILEHQADTHAAAQDRPLHPSIHISINSEVKNAPSPFPPSLSPNTPTRRTDRQEGRQSSSMWLMPLVVEKLPSGELRRAELR